jgi:hypothetical protein
MLTRTLSAADFKVAACCARECIAVHAGRIQAHIRYCVGYRSAQRFTGEGVKNGVKPTRHSYFLWAPSGEQVNVLFYPSGNLIPNWRISYASVSGKPCSSVRGA